MLDVLDVPAVSEGTFYVWIDLPDGITSELLLTSTASRSRPVRGSARAAPARRGSRSRSRGLRARPRAPAPRASVAGADRLVVRRQPDRQRRQRSSVGRLHPTTVPQTQQRQRDVVAEIRELDAVIDVDEERRRLARRLVRAEHEPPRPCPPRPRSRRPPAPGPLPGAARHVRRPASPRRAPARGRRPARSPARAAVARRHRRTRRRARRALPAGIRRVRCILVAANQTLRALWRDRFGIDAPRKIICVGLNYRDHAEEGGREPPDEPMLFAKFASALLEPGSRSCCRARTRTSTRRPSSPS